MNNLLSGPTINVNNSQCIQNNAQIDDGCIYISSTKYWMIQNV